jgi:hypothetical protein
MGGYTLRVQTIAFAVFMVLASAAFNASFAQSAAVSEKTFDWIFFAIIGIPFVLVLLDTLINDGWRPGKPDGVEKRYPPTVSDAFAARPLHTWRTPEDEEISAKPQPYRPGR